MFRRQFLGASASLALATSLGACAQMGKHPDNTPPIVFLHGNGDSFACWLTTVWRFETNGWPSDRLFALQQPYPWARDDDTVAQPGRSSSAEAMEFLKTEVQRVLAQTGAKQVVLVGSSRGGLTIRNYIQNGGGDQTVSHAILCGTPNHGAWAIAGYREGSEFSGTGPFLKALNAAKNEAGDEVTGPVKWLTLRSDRKDKYAQPEGDWVGLQGKPSGIDADGPALKGAENQVLAGLDHREVAYSAPAFAAAYRFITGHDPVYADFTSNLRVSLSGIVTGRGVNPSENHGDRLTDNLPLPGAIVEIFGVQSESGLRGSVAPQYRKVVGSDGRWGPFHGVGGAHYEFVVRAHGYAITHIYRSGFARDTALIDLQADRFRNQEIPAYSVIELVRPRGYLYPTEHHISFDGLFPPPGVPVQDVAGVSRSKIKLYRDDFRAISAEFHTDQVERVVGRTWSAKGNNIVRLEITQ